MERHSSQTHQKNQSNHLSPVDGTSTLPVDYRIYGKSCIQLFKNDYFRATLQTAAERGFQPYLVLFWQLICRHGEPEMHRQSGWQWFFRAKKPDGESGRYGKPAGCFPDCPGSRGGGPYEMYGFIEPLHSVNKAGKGRCWATNCLTIDATDRTNMQAIGWSIENHRRTLKDLYCVEDYNIHKEAEQSNYIYCSRRISIRLRVVQQPQNIAIYKAK